MVFLGKILCTTFDMQCKFQVPLLICLFLIVDLKTVRSLGVVYFLFLFFFSGLEFTLTFLMHRNFKYSRYITVYYLVIIIIIIIITSFLGVVV